MAEQAGEGGWTCLLYTWRPSGSEGSDSHPHPQRDENRIDSEKKKALSTSCVKSTQQINPIFHLLHKDTKHFLQARPAPCPDQ